MVGIAFAGTTTADTAGTGTSGTGDTDGRLVLVSGRDDHGLLATPTISLTDAPGSDRPTGTVADGTLAEAINSKAEWLRITTVEGPAHTGWINDYYLRGVLHVSGPTPTCRSRVAGRLLPAGAQAIVLDVNASRARIRTQRPPAVEGWVPREHLHELPPRGDHCTTESRH